MRIESTSPYGKNYIAQPQSASESTTSGKAIGNEAKSLHVDKQGLLSALSSQPGALEVIADILQSKYESMKRIVDNMVSTPEERRALEERRARIRKLKELAKERDLDEREAERILELTLTKEDKELLELYGKDRSLFA